MLQVCVASVARREELLVQLRDLEPQYADGSLARGAAAEAGAGASTRLAHGSCLA